MVRNANSSVWLILLTVTSFMLQSCKKETQEKQQTPFQGFVSPDNFPPVVYKFQDNKVTEAGFELGRRLFYDPMLSLDNTISCGRLGPNQDPQLQEDRYRERVSMFFSRADFVVLYYIIYPLFVLFYFFLRKRTRCCPS